MHGIGNDYIYVNCFKEKVKNPGKLARIISDRHTGIGGDGLILISPSKKADVRMRMFNADGSEAQMCGNGIRCVAKYVYEHKIAKSSGGFDKLTAGRFVIPGQPPFPASLKIETGRGVLTIGLSINKKGEVQKACVNMGEPILSPKAIPVGIQKSIVVNEPITVLGQRLLMTCVSMGNPHAVFFCKDVKKIELERLGPAIENHKMFPQRTNVHFVQVDSRTNVHFVQVNKKSEFTMRTWERGSGITLACGTGACACCVAAVLTKRCGRKSTAHLTGGDLELFWSEETNCVYMTGPAVEVFEGVFSLKNGI